MLALIPKLRDLLSPRERMSLFLLFLGQAGVATLEMAGIASIMPFIAVVASPDVIQNNEWLKLAYDFFRFSSLQSFLFFLGILVLGLLVFGNLFKALTTWAMLKYENQINYELARRILSSYLMRPYEAFLNRNTAEMGKNVLSEARTVVAGILSPGMQVLSNTFLGVLILGLLMVVNPFIAVSIAVVLGGFYALIFSFVRKRLVNIGEAQFEANSMKHKAANEALCGIKDLKIFGKEQVFLERFAIHAQNHAQYNAMAGVISQLPRYALETIAFGGILLIVLFFLGSDQDIGMIVPLLALYAFAGYRLLPALQQIFASISTVRFNSPALEILHRDLGGDRTAADADISLTPFKHLPPLPLKRELELRNVTYRYPGSSECTIKGISLKIPFRSAIGFVGATGSGKSTLVDLILGLLSPASGQLLVDGVEINSNDLPRWQRNLGYVPQHIYLCDDTITRNIAFGVPVQEIDMGAVVRAARIAKLREFVEEELPEGFETVIGERGIRLSGGQRQRIGIARALYRDPAVLILDEATSALDGITEAAVMEALNTLPAGKTVIMIAHRFTTVKNCDLIYLVGDGRITDRGTYDELLGSSPWFQAAARTGTIGG